MSEAIDLPEGPRSQRASAAFQLGVVAILAGDGGVLVALYVF